MRILVFTGPKTSGKDTAANYLLARSSLLRPGLFVRVNFADQVRSCCAMIFGFTDKEMTDQSLKEVVVDRWPNISPREGQQNLANLIRTMYGGDVWVKAWHRKIASIRAGCVICTDLRFPEELEELELMGAKIVYVQNDKVQTALEQGQANGDLLWSNVSETFYGLMKLKAHHTITNNGTIPELHEQVDSYAKEVFGDWGEWVDIQNGPNAHPEMGKELGFGISSQEKLRL